jgi:hypothetical protein
LQDGEGNILLSNREGFHSKYTLMFSSFPDLNCEIVKRMRVGRYVVDEELIRGRDPEPIHCVVVYNLSEDLTLIEKIRILK